MRPRSLFSPAAALMIVVVASILSWGTTACGADDGMKVEAILIWATNEPKSPDPKHKPVPPEVRTKLKDLPLKWSNYFEVNRKTLLIPVKAARKQVLSDKCVVEVKNLGESKVEVFLFGKGEQVVRQSQDFPVRETLVLGGNAPNATGWLVYLKRTQ